MNPPSTPKIQCAPTVRWGLFREADTISIQTTDNSAIQVTDLDGAIVHQGTPTSLHLTRGHYFVTCNGDATQFAVLPDDYAGADFLGMEAVGPYSDANIVDAVKPGWIRMHGGSGALWDEVQPSAGNWNWTAADAVMSKNSGSGRKVFWMAFVRPDWQTQDQQFISDYTNYIAHVVQRYGSQLYAIAIWNEPWTTCDQWGRLPNPDAPNQCMTNWQQMVRSYFNLFQAARSVVKSVAPSLRVIGPSWTNPNYGGVTDYLRELGGTSLLDALTFHDYECGSEPPDQNVRWRGTGDVMPRVDERVGALRTALRNAATPFLLDEVGFYGQSALGIANTGDPTYLSGLSWRRGMGRAVKTVVMYRAQGIQAIVPHVLSISTANINSNLEIYGYELGGRGPHPKTSAYLMSAYWLSNATLMDYRMLGRRVFLYSWQRPDNTSLLFAWTLEDQSVALTSSMTVRDIFGRTKQVSALTEEPVLFSSDSPDASALLSSVMAALAENINLPPILEPIANQSVMKDELLQFAVTALDPDNDSIIYSIDTLPDGATFDAATKTFSWTPTAGQIGAYEITFIATDARGLSTSATTTVTVLGTPEDGLIDEWKFDASSGTAALDSVGSNSGLLQNFNFNSSSGWGAGLDGNALYFDGIDDYVDLNSATIALTNNFTVTAWLYPQNAAAAGAFLSLRSSYLSSGLRFFVSRNSLDMQGMMPTGFQGTTFASGLMSNGVWQHVAVVYDKSVMTVYLNGASQGSTNWGGDFVMNPAGQSKIGAEGSYYFNGLIDDVRIYNRTLSPTEIQTLVQGDSPLALSPIGNKSIPAGQTLAINCTATGGSEGSRTFSATPLLAGATMNATSGAFAWTPTLSQVGAYGVTFAVSDGSANANQAVLITVTQTNAVPVLAPIGSSQVSAGQTLALAVSATDADGDALTYSASPLPSGVAFDAATGALSWTPQASQVGSYNVTFGVSDDKTNVSQTASITVITVTTANTPPVLKPIKPKRVRAGRRVRIALKAKDRDRDALTYSIDPLPAGATFDPIRRRFEWIPTVDQVGQYDLTAGVTDGYATSSQPMSITVY